MTTHTQWIEVRSDGAAPVPGWRCDGCGQVKWQDEQPDEACDICAGDVIAMKPETTEGTDPVPGATDGVQVAPAPPRRTRSRNPGLSQEDK